jgi:4-amino-4-deoxy-L-arabinose transferase-like glycosyltransferase
MMKNCFAWFQKREWVIVVVLAVVFILIRLPATSSPLHQDEYKWPIITNPTGVAAQIPHPPLGEFIYRVAGEIVGFNVHFRFVPLFFGLLNLFLFYYLLRECLGRKIAAVGATLFTLSYFCVLASLMVDTDGQILPFFFLLAMIGYFKFQNSIGRKKFWWLALLLGACLLGFFVKVSFALVICAIAADWLWRKKSQLTKKDVMKYLGFGAVAVFVLAMLLFLSQYVFSFFNLSNSIAYWAHFADFHRNWFQTLIQVVKAVLYLSPFLILVPFFLPRRDVKKVRPFLFYILFGLIFYIILFDFSLGALDRYLQFLIVPLCAVSAAVSVSVFKTGDNRRNKEYLLLGVLLALLLSLTLFVPQFVPSLYPKSAWISRALSLKWNFLYPFSGGSGPIGFYVSFLFMALSWIVSVALIVLGFFKKHLRKTVLLILIPISLLYNGVFAEEYLFGGLYGSAPMLVHNVVQFIKNDSDINYVTVYNDNGGYDIQQIGKYRKRLYTDPSFNLNDKIATLNQYKEFYLEINIPRIDPNSVYRKYLNSCKIIYDQTDHYISAIVYDCREAPDVKL